MLRQVQQQVPATPPVSAIPRLGCQLRAEFRHSMRWRAYPTRASSVANPGIVTLQAVASCRVRESAFSASIVVASHGSVDSAVRKHQVAKVAAV